MTRTNRVLAELLDYRLTCAVLTWFVHCVSCYRTHWSKSQVSDKASICVCLHHKTTRWVGDQTLWALKFAPG